jgi:hypothetical protein
MKRRPPARSPEKTPADFCTLGAARAFSTRNVQAAGSAGDAVMPIGDVAGSMRDAFTDAREQIR